MHKGYRRREDWRKEERGGGREERERGILKGKYKPERQLCTQCLFSQSCWVAVKTDERERKKVVTGGRMGERRGLLRYCWMNGPRGRRGMGQREGAREGWGERK